MLKMMSFEQLQVKYALTIIFQSTCNLNVTLSAESGKSIKTLLCLGASQVDLQNWGMTPIFQKNKK